MDHDDLATLWDTIKLMLVTLSLGDTRYKEIIDPIIKIEDPREGIEKAMQIEL